jgi:ABC-type nickel/cobalt efflux system permease component RcnA
MKSLFFVPVVWYNYCSSIHATSPVYALVRLLLLTFAVLSWFFSWVQQWWLWYKVYRSTYCQHKYNPTQYHQHQYTRHQKYNCQLQHLTSNVRALEQQLTKHMCISTTLTTQLAMQLRYGFNIGADCVEVWLIYAGCQGWYEKIVVD